MELLVTFSLLVLLSFLVLWWSKTRRSKSLPPGPPTVPFVGNLNINMSDLLTECRKFRQQYGDIFSLIFGAKTLIVVNGLDTLKELFINYGDVVNNRPDDFLIREICHYQGVSGSSGSLWKEHRSFALSVLRSFGFGKRSLEGKISEEIECFLERVKETNGQPFDVKKLIHISVSNIISSMTFGRRYDHNDEEFIRLIHAMSENLRNAEVIGLLTFLPFLKFIPGDPANYKGIMKNCHTLDGYLTKILEERRRSFDENVCTNYVDAYFKRQKEESQKENSTFTDYQLLRTTCDIFEAGTETTSTAIRWFILFMLHHPDIQTKMREEILDIVGDSRFPSITDRENLPFADAVLHETLRVANMSPLGFPHGLSRDLEFRGYLLPKDAELYMCLDSVLNDPDLFENPCEFNPNRFLTDQGELKGTENVYAFGIGRRICLGEDLAKMELYLFTTALIQRFQLLPTDSKSLPSLENFSMGVTRNPDPYTFRAVELN